MNNCLNTSVYTKNCANKFDVATKEEFMLVYTVKEIQTMLRISKSMAYALVKSGAFPVIKLGDTYRIPKEGFDKWVQSQ